MINVVPGVPTEVFFPYSSEWVFYGPDGEVVSSGSGASATITAPTQDVYRLAYLGDVHLVVSSVAADPFLQVEWNAARSEPGAALQATIYYSTAIPNWTVYRFTQVFATGSGATSSITAQLPGEYRIAAKTWDGVTLYYGEATTFVGDLPPIASNPPPLSGTTRSLLLTETTQSIVLDAAQLRRQPQPIAILSGTIDLPPGTTHVSAPQVNGAVDGVTVYLCANGQSIQASAVDVIPANGAILDYSIVAVATSAPSHSQVTGLSVNINCLHDVGARLYAHPQRFTPGGWIGSRDLCYLVMPTNFTTTAGSYSIAPPTRLVRTLPHGATFTSDDANPVTIELGEGRPLTHSAWFRGDNYEITSASTFAVYVRSGFVQAGSLLTATLGGVTVYLSVPQSVYAEGDLILACGSFSTNYYVPAQGGQVTVDLIRSTDDV